MTAMLSSALVSSSTLDSKTCKISVSFETTEVVPTEFSDTCVILVRFKDTVVIPVNAKECTVTQTYNKSKEVKLYIPQGSDIIFQFDDTDDSTDFSTLSAVTFDVWDSVDTGSTARISKTLASGIAIADTDKINVTLTGTDTNVTAQNYYFELWITTSGGSRYLLKFGRFTVEDTRKYD